MRKLLCLGMALVMGLSWTKTAWSQEDPAALLDKAIKAVGGEEKLGKLKAYRTRARGTLVVENIRLPFTSDVAVQLPDRFRTEMRVSVGQRSMSVVQSLTGEKGWSTSDGETKDLEPRMLDQVKEAMYFANIEKLVPLKEKTYTLTSAGEIQVAGRPAVGLKVSAKDHSDVIFFFDKESGLVVKTVRRTQNHKFLDVLTETFYSDYKDLDGVKTAGKVRVIQDGQLHMEVYVTEVKVVDKFEDSLFARP
jgi:hypothetical protein